MNLVRRLVEGGQEVIGADLRQPPASLPPVGWLQVDLCSPQTLDALPVGASDTVYCLAARQYMGPVPRNGRDEWFAEVNVNGTRHLLELLRRRGCGRLVYFSSDMVYGLPQRSPVTTDHPLNPAGPYGRSKKLAEQLCRSYRAQGMSITILRPRLIVGPGRLGILGRLFALIRRGLPVPLIGAGTNRYQMVSVHDCVSAAMLAVEAGVPNREFNLGSEDPPRVRDLLETVIRRVGSRSVLIPTPGRAIKGVLSAMDSVGLTLLYPDQFAIADAEYIVDVSDTRDSLGWKPQFHDEDMLMEAYQSYLRGPAAVAQ